MAALLILVLGGSFALLFRDLRSEFERNFSEDLESSAAAFRAQERERFKSMEVIASFLESSPSFRNVLRRSDYQTMHQYLLDVNGSMQVTLIVLTDASGKLLNRTDREGEQGTDLSKEAPVQGALNGEYINDYWLEGDKLYQVVSIPMVDSHDYVDGSLTLGFEINKSFLSSLKTELGGEVGFLVGYDWRLTTSPQLSEPETSHLLTRRLPLAQQGSTNPSKVFLLGKSLEPVQRFVQKSQLKLATLAFAALVLALLISLPLIGRMTNPVELLEKAQAEMRTIFTANLDGLLATDEKGIITTCNPAATVALGIPKADLIGSPLMEKLPASVHQQLESTPGISQTATFTRQGRDFKLYRTSVRIDDSDLLGSILLFHDVTQERKREKLFDQFLENLDSRLTEAVDQPELSADLKNLKLWHQLKRDSLLIKPGRVDLRELRHSLSTTWPEEPRLQLDIPSDSKEYVAADESCLKIILQNLVQAGLSETESEVRLQLVRNGGAFDFTVTVNSPDLALLSAVVAAPGEEPYYEGLGLVGLGLFVAARLLEQHQNRLQVRSVTEGKGREFFFTLPVAVEGEQV